MKATIIFTVPVEVEARMVPPDEREELIVSAAANKLSNLRMEKLLEITRIEHTDDSELANIIARRAEQ